MEEIYKDIEGYKGYQISNHGNVKSLNYNRTGKEKILKPAKDKNGYLMVCLRKQGKSQTHYIHRFVAQAFIPNPNNYLEINHRDEDKANNCVSNLEWCDRKHNINYGTRNEKLSKQVLCVETGVVYPSIMEVERELGFNNGNVVKCCNGKRKTCGGYTWRYVS